VVVSNALSSRLVSSCFYSVAACKGNADTLASREAVLDLSFGVLIYPKDEIGDDEEVLNKNVNSQNGGDRSAM
jgi:hypothetical protein